MSSSDRGIGCWDDCREPPFGSPCCHYSLVPGPIVGRFIHHRHAVDHENEGMMGIVKVAP